MKIRLLLTSMFVGACAQDSLSAELYRDHYPEMPLKASLTYSVDADVSMKSEVIEAGVKLLRTMGYSLALESDPSLSDVQFHMEHEAWDNYCDKHPGTIAYHHSHDHECGGIWICDSYAHMRSPTLIAHETAHALGVDHIAPECTPDLPETQFGQACGGSNIMDPGLGFEATDFTVQDAASFEMLTLWNSSIFGKVCRKHAIPEALKIHDK